MMLMIIIKIIIMEVFLIFWVLIKISKKNLTMGEFKKELGKRIFRITFNFDSQKEDKINFSDCLSLEIYDISHYNIYLSKDLYRK